MTERVRLADLARQAGVSTATVSRVLNGKETVAPATRQAVLTALDLLGYERPERLRQRPGGLIGLIVPELSNPIFPSFAQNLETTMAARTPTSSSSWTSASRGSSSSADCTPTPACRPPATPA